MDPQALLKTIRNGERLPEFAACGLARALFQEKFTPDQSAEILRTLRQRGETVDEIVGFATVLRELALPVPFATDDLIDTCGTGGGPSGLNVSTVTAIVAAAAGCRVAKHCNRAVTSHCGSADLLAALGICYDGGPELAARSLAETGVAFLFAPAYHPALKALAPVRRSLSMRTILNICGPLANPARVRRQIVGVFERSLVRPVAEVLQRLGSHHALVVFAHNSADEIATDGPTQACELRAGAIRELVLQPSDFALTPSNAAELHATDANTCAQLTCDILKGRRFACRDVVIMNAGAAIYVAGRASTLCDGAVQAAQAIDSGAALKTLQSLQRLSEAA